MFLLVVSAGGRAGQRRQQEYVPRGLSLSGSEPRPGPHTVSFSINPGGATCWRPIST